jgi:hypothetical protein
VKIMKLLLATTAIAAAAIGQVDAGHFECGACQSLLHYWSNARTESSFESVCDAFPNYVPLYPDPKTGVPTPAEDADAPKDGQHGLPVTHMERCRRVMDTLLLRLAEEGIVQVKDLEDAQVFAPTTWENPAILEILCTYVYPKLGEGYCKGSFGGAVDSHCAACIDYVHTAHLQKTDNPSCVARPEADEAECQFVEERIRNLPAGTDAIGGTIKAMSRARNLDLEEGRFLACRDFLDICNESISNPVDATGKPKVTFQQLQDNYSRAYDPYWAARKQYTVPSGAAAVQNALATSSKVEKKGAKKVAKKAIKDAAKTVKKPTKGKPVKSKK